jgi:hypothetical protein
MIFVPPHGNMHLSASQYPRCISFVALAWHPVTGHAEHGTRSGMQLADRTEL